MATNDTSGASKEHHTNQLQTLRNKDEERHQLDAEEEQKNEETMGKKTRGERIKEFKTFIWNPETRECLGRSGKSWSLILLFYIVLYTFLAGMFILYMYAVLIMLSPYTPRYRDRVAPPGVTIRPYIKQAYNIAFRVSEPSSWQPYVDNLELFLKEYDDKVQETRNVPCTPGAYFVQDSDEAAVKKACQFKRSQLMKCSGVQDQTFGYSQGQPCILLKMNRIIGYQPGYGTPITKGEQSHLQSLDFFPSETFDPMYFPYYGKLTHVNYTQPVVAIHFTGITRNQTLDLQCQLNGKGIINTVNNDRFLGRIIFTLTVNS
ncbi:protein ATP1B4 isoform X2 [Notechis scutatus]|uniref:Sodium/potassium-transporting ATPase subunit beta n=1 Tax=Notechis scutatus TaxID=8663 RepID=A0A6J1USC6_9SAUR|nr:protein ATP1B4 isoform X2 [Notechis scutatus]